MLKIIFLKKQLSPVLSLFLVSCLITFFASCSTSVPVTVTRPPNWNTAGIKRIAVQPFTVINRNSDIERQLAQELTNTAIKNILGTGQFTLVDYAEVARLEKAGETVANHVDAIFSGSITRLAVDDKTDTHTKDDETTYTYSRTVNFNFSYMLKRASDGSIIGQDTKSNSAKDSNGESPSELASEFDIARPLIGKGLQYLNRDIAPWEIVEKRTFANDETKDPSMKLAAGLVKKQDFSAALASYTQIYNATHNFAAGYNAALLTELMGNSAGAISLMQRVYSDTGNSKAKAEAVRMQKTVADAQEVAQAYVPDNGSMVDAAIKKASEELAANLPAGSNISIINASKAEAKLADYVVQGLTASLSKSGINVIDRGNIDTILKEQNLQASGFVSDDSAVSIGNLQGIGILVSCSISGTGSLRRLSITAIAVETGKTVYQGQQEI